MSGAQDQQDVVRNAPPPGKGVRALTLEDQLPDCPVRINAPIYDLAEITRGKRVIDVGCGYGRNRPIVEGAGGEWIGVEPFEGGAHMVAGSAEALPFEDSSADIIILDAVLEHVEDVEGSFREIERVLRPGGAFIGYVAFMECFHEISYNHISYMGLQSYARRHALNLEMLSGGSRFGIDYHLAVIAWPLPFGFMRPVIAAMIRGTFRLKSWVAYAGLRLARRWSHVAASEKARNYYQLECLRQSNGFSFIIRKPDAA